MFRWIRRRSDSAVISKKDHDLTCCAATELDVWFTKISEDPRWGDLNKLNYLRDFKMFFRFCVRQKYLASNPMEDRVFDWANSLSKKLKSTRSVSVFTLDEEKKLRHVSLNRSDKAMLPWFAIAFFSGNCHSQLPPGSRLLLNKCESYSPVILDLKDSVRFNLASHIQTNYSNQRDAIICRVV